MDITEFESVKRWESRLKPNSFRVALIVFNKWYRWVRENKPKFATFSPDDFVEYQKNAGNGTRYDILDTIQNYVGTMNGRASYKCRVLSGVRSFFMHNRAELPKDPSFIIRGDVEKVVGKLKVEDVRKIVLSCNPMYQAIFLSLFQGGMGIGEFEHWNLHGLDSLEKQLSQKKEAIKIDLPGRKKVRNIRPFYTFIGGDAIDRIKKYLPYRQQNSQVIFVNQIGTPISRKAIQQYWIRHLRKLGYVPPINHGVGRRGDTSKRYGLNVHELRDCFRSQWEKSPAKASVAEFCMGHVVDPLEYNKAFRDEAWTRREYLKALSMLQIMSSGKPFGLIEEEDMKEDLAAAHRMIKELEAKIERERSVVEEEKESIGSLIKTMIDRIEKLEKDSKST